MFTPSKNESHSLKSDIVDIVSYEPSNKFYLKEPYLIRNADNMQRLITIYFSDHVLQEHYGYAADDRLIGIYAMGIRMTLLDYPIRSKVNLPEYIVKSNFIISLDNVENNMCFWACLALIKGARKNEYTKLIKQLFSKNYNCYNNNYLEFDYVNELNAVKNVLILQYI